MATIILRKKKVKSLPPKKHQPITIVVMASSVDGDDRCERCGDYFDGLEDYDGRLVCGGCVWEMEDEKAKAKCPADCPKCAEDRAEAEDGMAEECNRCGVVLTHTTRRYDEAVGCLCPSCV